uniref:Putative ovule protein n=1 Tax=Solanum chacoense TaxID=4108 RepID=A0A0V0GR83_SOLCH
MALLVQPLEIQVKLQSFFQICLGSLPCRYFQVTHLGLHWIILLKSGLYCPVDRLLVGTMSSLEFLTICRRKRKIAHSMDSREVQQG